MISAPLFSALLLGLCLHCKSPHTGEDHLISLALRFELLGCKNNLHRQHKLKPSVKIYPIFYKFGHTVP